MSAFQSGSDSGDPVAPLREALKDRYTLGAEMGRGAMSVVYRARDLRYDRDVAIKVMRAELSITLGAERFLREIQIAARLQHPHIVPLFDSGEADGLLYYVMPCIDGESLRERIAREAQLPIADALRIAREVGAALGYAHSHGIIHRDIKPGNILLSSGVAIVADFGIARAVQEAGGEDLTTSGVIVGTPGYMSPEQSTGEARLDGRTDIYSLGCVLFEMLAGEPPFTGRTPQAILARHIQEAPPTLHVVRSNVSQAIEGVIERSLAKAPADRFKTAEHFIDALRSAEAAPPQPRRHTTRARRTQIVIGVVVLAAAATLGGRTIWPPAPSLDLKKVVVYPLSESGLTLADSGSGYRAALAVALALENTHPLKAIDGSRHLDQSLSAATGRLPAAAAGRIAKNRGARYYIEGALRRDVDSLVLTLSLNDAAGDSLIVQKSATGAVGMPLHIIAFDAVRLILPALLDAGRDVELRVLTDRHPAAIALFIQGDVEYRSSRFGGALDFYRRAVEQDSALAIAAIKGAQAASWSSYSQEAQRLIAIAMAHDSLLPPRYASFGRGLQAYLAGRADTAVKWLERARAEDPDWAEADMALGEVFYHLLPSRAPLDSLAEAAFVAARRSDSTFTPPLVHLAEIAIRRAEIAPARVFIDQLHAVRADSTLDRYLEISLSCVQRGAQDMDWAAIVKREPAAVRDGAKILSVGGAQAGCAESGFRAVLAAPDTPNSGWAAALGLHGLLVARGRFAEALSLLDSLFAAGRTGVMPYFVLDLQAGAPAESRGVSADSLTRKRFGEDYATLSPEGKWLMGIWHAWRGDSAKVRMLQRAIAARAVQPGAPRARMLAEALAAHLSLLAHDTSDAIRRLRALTPVSQQDTLAWGYTDALPVERLLLARLLLARGQNAEALDVASAFDHPGPIVYLPFLAVSLDIRYRAAQALGRRVSAAQSRVRLEALGRRDLLDAVSSPTTRREE